MSARRRHGAKTYNKRDGQFGHLASDHAQVRIGYRSFVLVHFIHRNCSLILIPLMCFCSVALFSVGK